MNRQKDGLFTYNQSTTLKDRLENFGRAEPLLEWWTNEAEKILQEQGYPLDLQALWESLLQGEHAPEIHDIRAMLFRLNEVRRAIGEQRTEAAIWNMALAVQHGMKAKLRPFEPDVSRGQSNVSGGMKGGKLSGRKRREKAEPEHSLWQAEAEKIWMEHPTWSKIRVATKISKTTGGNPNTIRRIIQKPTP